ncbi:uncharacterized protein CLUP02_13535 [Colletotrichum lupini]|uniref:Uncharacterized protein n=1 Tax=Colletotrichum lupini TaxID=145971 RepID=A0A9Q8WLI3_9PEZI|nr:uncharacterized protein CLUP02_13535 [Colletotrichum lupini]UQC88013.1 hypothetical protein CLUP02_13535 [Colletotrichum lupini]
MSVTILILGREPTRHYNIIDNSKDPTRSAVSGLQHTGTDTSIRSQTTDPEQSDSAAPTREIPGARIHARRSDTIPAIIDTIPSQATRTFHLPCPSASGHVYLRLQPRPRFKPGRSAARCCSSSRQIREMMARWPALCSEIGEMTISPSNDTIADLEFEGQRTPGSESPSHSNELFSGCRASPWSHRQHDWSQWLGGGI